MTGFKEGIMRALFVHDHKFRQVGNRIYTSGGLPNTVLKRYVDIFGTLDVVARVVRETRAMPKYNEIDLPAVTIHPAAISLLPPASLVEIVPQVDAVIARIPSINAFHAIRLARRLHKPCLVEIVGCILDTYRNYSLTGKLVALPAFLYMRHVVRHLPWAVYVTHDFLQGRYPCSGITTDISNVDLPRADDSVCPARIRRRQEERHDVVRLGTAAATDVAHKGQRHVIEAIPHIEQQSGIRVEYQLAGGGDPSFLQRVARNCGVEDRVTFLGRLPHEAIFSWLDSLDLYVQPSLQEGLCRSVIEAMGRGLPCVVSDAGGNPELIDAEFVAPVSPKKSFPDRIANCVAEIWQQENYVAQCRTNFGRAHDRYERDRLDRRRTEFFRKFISSFASDTAR